MTEEQLPDEVTDQRQAFDEERRRGIFSTDVAAILGLSRYGTALSVYKAKRGELDEREMSLPAWIGLRLESLVSELYTAATGNRLRADNLAHFHPAYKWLGCHLDRRVIGASDTIVELKTRNSMRGWGDDGSADIPTEIWCQVQEQMYVVGGKVVHVAVLFSNSSFRVYRVEPDPVFESEVLPKLEDFWYNYFLAGVPPLPTGHDVDSDLVKRVGGGDSGFLKPATAAHTAIVDAYRLAKINAAQATYALTALENRIKDIIGKEADGLTGPFGTIYWKRNKGWTEYKWQLIAGAYKRAIDELLDMAQPSEEDLPAYAAIQTQLPLIPDLHSVEREGARVFRPDLVEA